MNSAHSQTPFTPLPHPSTATHCNILQHTVDAQMIISTQSKVLVNIRLLRISQLQHTATHCNTLQHPATPCNTLRIRQLRKSQVPLSFLGFRRVWMCVFPQTSKALCCDTLLCRLEGDSGLSTSVVSEKSTALHCNTLQLP